MSLRSFATFNKPNRRLIGLLIASHLLWVCAVFALWVVGSFVEESSPWWAAVFISLQLYSAAQLLLPALLLHPEERTRSFYLFWGITLSCCVWLVNLLTPTDDWRLLLELLKSGLLLLIATLIGAALARYVHRLREIIPICIVMTLADFVSWLVGPTATFVQELKQHYISPEGPPPLVDMILVKLAFPGSVEVAPVFGVSDWIMVVFFAIVARRFEVNDNLLGASGESMARRGLIGCYLPVPVAALLAVILLVQASGLFLPALPLIALVMLVWHAGRYMGWVSRKL